MKKVKTLLAVFDNQMELGEVPAFRGAIIEKVGRDNLLFHNHKGENELLYQYPLIQYKVIRGRPAVFCVGDGVDSIHKLFSQRNWDLKLNGEKYEMKIDRLNMNNFTLNVWEKSFNYQIANWLALNAENYKIYKNTKPLSEKIQLLERLLTGNILSFARGIEWQIEKTIVVRITDITKEKILKYKNVPLQAFDIKFSTNVFLPDYIGLGKSVSHGFGTVKSIKQEQHEQ